MTPNSGPTGTSVTLSGTGLGNLACAGGRQISQFWVAYGDISVACSYEAATGNIHATVPSNATAGAPFVIKKFVYPPSPCFVNCQTTIATISTGPRFAL